MTVSVGPETPPPPILFGLVPGGGAKLILAFALSTAGLYYVNRGRQEQNVGKMLRGSALVLASLFALL